MKKKIAFIKPGNIDLVGGGERVLINIANHLVKNYDVTIITYSSVKTYYPIDGRIKIIPLGLVKSKQFYLRMFQPFLYIRKLAKLIKQNDINDVIAFSDIGAYLVFFSFLFNTNFKKYIWLHNSYYQPINKIIKLTRLFVFKSFDKIIVLNKMDEAIYKQKLGKNKVIRIPNPLSFELEISSTLLNKKIVSIGRFHKEKGYVLLIEASRILFKKYPDWSLEIFGQDRGEEKILQELIVKYNLANNVFIKKPVKDIQKIYLNSSIYVMTSFFECFPLVLTEAAEAGLPLVAFNSPSGISDIVIDNKNGYLVKRFNIKELAEKMIKLMDSYELRCKLGIEAKRRNNQFHIEPILVQWFNLLDD